jgi:PadR family transcriptional regulator AphA
MPAPSARAQPSVGPLSLADEVCLAIIGEAPIHGWAIVKLLAPDGPLGRIWSLSRPLTYRSIDRLVDAGFVERTDAGRRAILRATTAGRRRRRRWLDRPVDHLRELRTVFLLKLALRDRAGLPRGPLVATQRSRLADAIDALTATPPASEPPATVDPVELWRRESALAADRFLRGLVGDRHEAEPERA